MSISMDHHRHHRHRHHLSMWPTFAVCLLLLQATTSTMAIDLSRLYGHMANPIVKRSGK